jgi:signal transduction histidine kinase
MNNSKKNPFMSVIREYPFRVSLFFLFSTCILTVSLVFFFLSMSRPYMGIALSMDNQGWAVKSVDLNGVAFQAAIAEGDKPIEINGQPAETFLKKYERQGIVLGPLIEEITVRNDLGQTKSIALRDGLRSWQSLTELISFFVVCLIFWIVGFYTLFRRLRNPAALLLCLCGLTFGLALSANIAGERAIPLAIPLAVAAALYDPWLLVHFFIILPEERIWLHNKPQVYLIYLPATIMLVLFFLVGYSEGQPLPWFRTVRLLEYGIGFLAIAGMVIFNYLHAVSFRTKQQMKVVLISCFAALIPFFILYLFPVLLWQRSIIPTGFSILFMGFIPIGLGYAVVKRQLMDIDVIIRRGMVYGLITLVMAAVVSVAIFLVGIFHTSVGIPLQILASLVVGGLAAILFGPIKKRIDILIDRLFYKDRYDYRPVIQSLSSALNSVNSLSDISRLIVGTIVNTLNLMGGCLFIKTQSDSLEIVASQGTFIDTAKQEHLRTLISQRNSMIEFPNSVTTIDSDIAFLIRVLAGEKEIGVLCLSKKASGQNFSSDDLFLLQGISSVAAIALHSAMLIHDVSMRDTFVSIASHELRTPLTAITGYADLLLRRDPPDATRKKWLKNILDNGQRITAMANDLLNVTRIQSGKLAVKLERLKLPDILSEQTDVAREFTDKHKFVVNIDPNLPNVIVDRDKFGQVIANLLNNAIKYSPNGGRVTLSAYHNPSQNCVVVSITDEGIGISPEDKGLLFTTFHRIQRPETQGIRGSGLGLFIAKEWTEAMGGKIWVESELNKGSTFFVTIPT